MNLAKLRSALGRHIDGVLGYSFLKNRIVQIDYPNRKVRFYSIPPVCESRANSPVPKCTTLPFRYVNDLLVTGVAVNGHRVVSNVDTGSNSYFQLSPAAVHKLGLTEAAARAPVSNSVGFNGKLNNHEGTVRNVTVGTISLDQPTVVFLGNGMGVDNEPWDLRIGNKFLKEFVVLFDFQHDRITLAKPGREISPQ